MRVIRVGILLNEIEHSKDLAKRLSEISKGLYIDIIEDKVDCKNYDVVIDDDVCDMYISAPRLLNWIRETYEVNTGNIISNFDGEMTVISLYSETGGAGVTVISLALARIISTKYAKKTLYVDIKDSFDWEKYFEFDESMEIQANESNRNSRELSYHIESGRPCNMQKFFAKDIYDVYGGTIYCDVNKFIDAVKRETDFEVVIIDVGKCRWENLPEMQKNIKIVNHKDMRSYIGNQDQDNEYIENDLDELCIYNNSIISSNRSDSEKIRIAFEKESFTVLDKPDKVEISMTGKFSSGICCLAEKLFGDEVI